MVDSCPNSLGVPSHKPLAYLQEFGLPGQFGQLSTGDRPNCVSKEFRVRDTCSLLPKVSNKLRPLIRNDSLQNSVQA
jgi:hypothetical protein